MATAIKKSKKVKIFSADGSIKAKFGTAGLNGKKYQFNFGEELEAPEGLLDALNCATETVTVPADDGKGVTKQEKPRFIVQYI